VIFIKPNKKEQTQFNKNIETNQKSKKSSEQKLKTENNNQTGKHPATTQQINNHNN
jgi:hypothetical protein